MLHDVMLESLQKLIQFSKLQLLYEKMLTNSRLCILQALKMIPFLHSTLSQNACRDNLAEIDGHFSFLKGDFKGFLRHWSLQFFPNQILLKIAFLEGRNWRQVGTCTFCSTTDSMKAQHVKDRFDKKISLISMLRLSLGQKVF